MAVDIADIFNGFQTDEGRHWFVRFLLENTNTEIPEACKGMASKVLDHAIQGYRKTIELALEEEHEPFPEFLDFHIILVDCIKAINVAKRLGLPEKEGDIKAEFESMMPKLLSVFIKKNDFYQAAMLCEKMGRLEEAIGFYEKSSHADKAAELAEQAGQKERARSIAEKALASGAGNLSLLLMVGKDNITRQQIDEAIVGYELVGNFRAAAKVCRMAGMAEKAEFYEGVEKVLASIPK